MVPSFHISHIWFEDFWKVKEESFKLDSAYSIMF